MQIGDFEITDYGGKYRMKYVGKPMYITTASSNNHSWVKELLNKWYGRHEFVYKAPPWEEWIYEGPPLVNIEEDHDWWRGGICRPGDPKHIAQIIDEVNKAKKEKETAMDKDMKDYVGCYLKEVEFNPPYTTILWGDDTATQVKCVDEPYDPEKGFAMAVQKKLFGRNYYKNMESIIKRDGGYEKATPLVKCIDGEYFGFEDSTAKAEEIQKLKKENDRLLTEVNTLDAVRYGIAKANEEFKKDLDKMREMNRHAIFENKMLDDTNIALKSAVESLKKNNAAYKKENEDLKKAKENMAKKLAETKSLRQENAKLKLHLDAQMLNNGELDRENQKLRRDAEIKSNLIDRQREDIHRLREWFKREAEKVSNLQRRNNTQAESIHTLLEENETLKTSIEQIKEILK